MEPDSRAGGIARDLVWVEVNSIIVGEREGDVSSRDRGVIFNFNPVQLIRPAERGGRWQRRRAGEGTALEGSGKKVRFQSDLFYTDRDGGVQGEVN